uniref:Pentraxin family member n=1 Tax=Leptobrachium leishanense TaxID=445787 RepID=A0A8C5QKG6_9ANUR
MKRYVLCLVFFAAYAAQEDLINKVFLFPKETATAHVILKPEPSKPLGKFTVCLRSYTELTREHYLFSLATAGKDNTFYIGLIPPNLCIISINQEDKHFKVDAEVLDWKHTCVSWDSDSGVIQLWVNGKVYLRKVSNKGFTIPSPASIILGQEQDSYGGHFDAGQSFVGEMCDVHMWDYELTPEDIKNVQANDKHGNVLSWKSLSYEIKGDVLVLPKLQCKSLGYTASLYSLCY